MLKKEALATLKLSWPIILGELTQMSLGLINTAMVGHISYKQLAAAALVNSIVNMPYIFGIGLTMSISQTVATSQGANDKAKASHYFFNGFILSAIVSILIALFLHFATPVVFHLKQAPEVAAFAAPYLEVMGWSVIPMLLYFAIKQFTDGLEKTRVSMLLAILALPLNVLLNWILIYGNLGSKKYELIGAAYGTLITRTIILILMIIVLFVNPHFKKYVQVRKSQWKIDWKTMASLLKIGIPTGLQALLEVGAFAVSGILAGMLGAVDEAAHNIALQSAAFTYMVSMGLAQGASIRIGNASGRNDIAAIQRIGKSTLYAGLCYGISCAILFILFRNNIPNLFTQNTSVASVSAFLLLFAAIFQISDATQAIAVGSLRGIRDVKVPTYLMIISYWLLGLPIGILTTFYFHMGIQGIWIGFIIGLTFTSIFLNARFQKLMKKSVL